MSYQRSLIRRWSRRDRLAVLVVALTVAFLVGTALLVLAAGEQTAAIATEYGTRGVVERYESVATARKAAPTGAIVLPVATATRLDGRRVTVVARTEERVRLGSENEITLFDAERKATMGRIDKPRTVSLEGNRGTVELDVRPRESSILSPAWYVASPRVVNRLGPTGALVVRPTTDPVPTRGVPLLSAFAFFVLGTRDVIHSLSIAALGGGLLVGVTVYSVTRMTVRDRLPTIRLVRATGARPRDVLLVFGLRGALISAVGVALGYAGGVILPNAALNVAVFLGLPTSLALDVTGRAAWIIGLLTVLTLGVGTVAGMFAARPAVRRPPARLGSRSMDRDPRRSVDPRLLEWGTLVPTGATLTAFVIFAILVAGMAGAVAPLASTDGATIVEPGATHPIASDVPVAYADVLRSRGIAASPEILAFAVTDGQPFVVRGANATAFVRVTDAEIVRGRYPRMATEALLGTDLARTLDLEVGDRLLLGGSTTAAVTEVRIVGTMSAPGVFDDQILVSLATARHLTDRAPGRVQFIRTSGLPDVPADRNGSIGVVDVSVPARVPANATVEVRIRVRNDGLVERTRSVTVGFNGTTRTRRVTLDRGASRTFSVTIPTGSRGTYTLRVGEVRHRIEVVSPDAIEITGLPANAPPGSAPRIRILTLTGDPAGNVTVSVGNRTLQTGTDGAIRIPLDDPGKRVISASDGDETASATIVIRPNVRRTLLTDGRIDPASPGVLTRPVVRLDLDNPWNRTLSRIVRIEAPGGTRTRNVTLAPGGTESITMRLPRRPPGRYGVEIEIGGETVWETTYRVTGDDRIAAAIAEGGRLGQSGLGRATETAFGNLELVLGVIVGLAGLMTVGGTTATFSRAVHGRRRTIGVYRATGAPPKRVIGIVLGDALRIGIVATLLSLGAGVTVLLAFETAGLLSPFGVRISPFPSPKIVIGIALGSLVLALLGATLATVGLLSSTPASLLTDERGGGTPGETAGVDVRE